MRGLDKPSEVFDNSKLETAFQRLPLDPWRNSSCPSPAPKHETRNCCASTPSLFALSPGLTRLRAGFSTPDRLVSCTPLPKALIAIRAENGELIHSSKAFKNAGP